MELFNAKMKLADVISSNHNLILLLSRMGIQLGFGEKTIEEVCMQYQVSKEFVLMVFNVSTFDDYSPSDDYFINTDMSMLVPFLKASHHHYLNERLPHIEKHLNHLVDSVDERYGKILKKFYADFTAEISDHFRFEEGEVFSWLNNNERNRSLFSDFADSHENLNDALLDLTQIVYKYLPSNVMPDDTIELVFDILQLSADLEKHTQIEEKILIPYAKTLERSCL